MGIAMSGLPDSQPSRVMTPRLDGNGARTERRSRPSIETPVAAAQAPAEATAADRLRRIVNIVLATIALVLVLPVLALIAILIKLTSRGPVFYTQVRVGLDRRSNPLNATNHRRTADIGGLPFRIYKFRTMGVNAENGTGAVWATKKDPRITPIGGFLRQYRLDELPQLINVIRGEMSLVGPRPLILDEDQYVERWARRRLELKPGMTGLWQVLGASDIPFDEMTKLDYLYVTNWSLWLDVKLLLRTLPVVVHRRGAN
jgi:lipopolysaccharide/colanic/teichoic acid biosynthesis glycosyltransferase